VALLVQLYPGIDRVFRLPDSGTVRRGEPNALLHDHVGHLAIGRDPNERRSQILPLLERDPVEVGLKSRRLSAGLRSATVPWGILRKLSANEATRSSARFSRCATPPSRCMRRSSAPSASTSGRALQADRPSRRRGRQRCMGRSENLTRPVRPWIQRPGHEPFDGPASGVELFHNSRLKSQRPSGSRRHTCT
jgi:hypothetical protein